MCWTNLCKTLRDIPPGFSACDPLNRNRTMVAWLRCSNLYKGNVGEAIRLGRSIDAHDPSWPTDLAPRRVAAYLGRHRHQRFLRLLRGGGWPPGGRQGLHLPWLLLEPVRGLRSGPDAPKRGRIRSYGLPLGDPQGTLDTTGDGLEHFGHWPVALPLRPQHLRASGTGRGVPGRCEKRCSVGNHHLRRADPERLLRGILALLGGLHPLRLWCLGFRGAAQVGWGALGSACPPSYSTHT